VDDLDFGPLSVLYCWQSVLLAIGVSALSHGFKALLDVAVGGQERRRRHLILHRLVLPATPIILGAVGAVVVPLHPEALIAYVQLHALTGVQAALVHAGYGAAVGQFADYVWHRFSGVRSDMQQKQRRREEKRVAKVVAAAAEELRGPPANP
jgi:hypothetical protein